MKKEKATVALIHNGEEVDITQGLDEISKLSKIIVEVKGQISNLLDTHALTLYKGLKLQGNELAISFAVKLKASSENCDVATDISYVMERVKDGLDGCISFQEGLFDKKAEDAA